MQNMHNTPRGGAGVKSDNTFTAKENQIMDYNQNRQAPLIQPQGGSSSVGLAVASMVLGICALVLACCVPYLPIIFALLAVILGGISLAKKMGGTGMAVAGLVCGIIGLIPAVIVIISGAALLGSLSGL